MEKLIRILTVFFAFVFGHVAIANNDRSYAYSFQWENDSFAFKKKTDRWYTNGLRFSISYDTQADQYETDASRRYSHSLNFLTNWFCANSCTGRGWSIGHNFYTPSLINRSEPQPDDRPWAGWAYYGIHAHRLADNERSVTNLEVDLGVIGPIVQSEFIQREWHEFIGTSRMPLGWNNQLRNEPAFVVDYQQRMRFGGSNFDMVMHYGSNAGTVMISGYGGLTVRLGRNIRGFGIQPSRPTKTDTPVLKKRRVEQSQPLSVETEKRPDEWWRISEWYFFAFTELRAVAHNIFLDGNVLRSSPHSVDKKHVIPEVGWGFSVRWNNNRRVSYIRTKRGQEFEAPANISPKAQTFGALVFTAELD